jgi:hypothetical protein|nr:MAG TPA: hypothetical protein [Caudoviricetes sp.]
MEALKWKVPSLSMNSVLLKPEKVVDIDEWVRKKME